VERVLIRADGAARGNPGPAAAGAVLIDLDAPDPYAPDAPPVASISRPLGIQTNNYAEYTAVILALERALALGAREAELVLDSQLVVEQLSGRWKVKHASIKPLVAKVQSLLTRLHRWSIRHERRASNFAADALANLALDDPEAAVAVEAGRKGNAPTGMRIGVKPGQLGLSIDELRRCWREAEDAGFESLWVFDHLTHVGGERVYEATALLAGMAETTSRLRIGCLVFSTGTRKIETLAATLATIDALAGGRLEVGLGAASEFAHTDFDALGIPFGRLPDRISEFQSALDRLTELTSSGSPLGARPVQSPLPVILGGSSARIRNLAIERGLAWNLSTDSVKEFNGLKVGQPDPQAQIFVKRTSSVPDAVEEFRLAGATRLVLVLEPPIERGQIAALARSAGL
jgi:alkanesulfonate monooxygenase SsuD/methylene tetrahydromethanopterin reductase-like flavin-dependent oxidoreductase (luciferase family)/ribonuclease HI